MRGSSNFWNLSNVHPGLPQAIAGTDGIRMKLLLVDDHPLFLLGLRQVFADATTAIETFEAHDFDSAFMLLETHPVLDWICLDLQMPGGDGFSFMRALTDRQIRVPVAILSALEDPAMVHRALHAGAMAYLAKSMGKSELIVAIAALRDQGHYISITLRQPLQDYRTSLATSGAPRLTLTRRQSEVLNLLAAGRSNQAIASTLHIAESTVKGHVSTLFDLLQVDNRAGCTRAALQYGLID
jgi:DNA-binding NarL/FixJ family response regulator